MDENETISPEPNTSSAPETPAAGPPKTSFDIVPPAGSTTTTVTPTVVTPTPTEPTAASTPPVTAVAKVSPSPHHSKAKSLVITLIMLAIVGTGLFLVYHYGQTKSTPATTVKKDVALVRVGSPEPLPVSFYPNVDDSTLPEDVDSQAFEGLTSFHTPTQVGPQLALSWTNPDSSTWIFKLHPNVKFHTGRTMTATDVKASLDDIQNFKLGPEYGSTIKAVSVVDPLTVKITTDGADPILPNELANLFIYDTTSKTINNPINGTGPYTLKPGSSTKTTIDMVAFDGYYGGRPYVRELIFNSFANGDVAVAAINTNKVDVASVLTKAGADKVTNSNYNTLAIPTPTVAHLVPNTLNGGPLSKLAVRQAIMQAIDVSSLLKARGIVGTPATQIVAPSIPGYDPSLTRPTYDVAAAKQALTAAGYPNGFSFTFTYYTGAQDLATELTRQLALIGVTVKQDPQTSFDTLGAKVFGGLTDMYYNSLATSVVDATDYFSPILSNTKTYNNPAISKVFTEASQTLDPTKRLTLLKQVSDMLVADRADLPLYVVGDIYFEVPKNLVVNHTDPAGEFGIHYGQAYGQ